MSRLTKKFEDNSGYTPVVNHPVRKEITLYDFEEEDYDCCVEKLGKLEDLEEEFGCPLEVVFKALKEDIIDVEGSRVSVCLEYIQASEEWLLIGKFCRTAYFLKDYQKTWWLKGEK